jgi:tRNA A-37 threonylcarbamoyl transferase component Bud32
MSRIEVDKIVFPSLREWKNFSDRGGMDVSFTESDVCSIIEDGDTTTSNVKILRRIGSQSGEGEVYEIEYHGQRAAMKLLPYTSFNSFQHILNEIEIAQKLGGIIAPRVFAYALKCDNIDASRFVSTIGTRPEVERYNACSAIVDHIAASENKTAAKRFRVKCLNGDISDADIVTLLNDYGLTSPKMRVGVLISELLKCDLNNFMTLYQPSNETMRRVVSDIIHIVGQMHDLGVYHGDLHSGNFLVEINDKDEYVGILVHDFGHSVVVNNADTNINANLKNDLAKIFNSLLSRTDLSNEIRQHIFNLKQRL